MVQSGTEKERLGKALRVGALLATLLALAAVIVPRLAFSGGGGSDSDPTAASLPAAGVAAAAPGGEPAGTTTTTAATPVGSTTTTSTTTTTTAPEAAPPATVPAIPPMVIPPPAPLDDGAVHVSLAGLYDGLRGPERVGFFAGDRIGWRFRVTNSGGEYLWGVYAYLELHGPLQCSARRLEVGESTECWAETEALPGVNDAETWVTAWTTTRMVSDRLSHRIAVAAG